MRYFIGVDIGTSGTKAVLYNEKGKEISSAFNGYKLFSEKSGYAEQNPLDWYDATIKCLSDITKNNGVDAKDIKGVGLSGQMHGLVMLDKDNKVLSRSIIWCDTRCDEQVNFINSHNDYFACTLNPAIVGFTLPKLLWIKENKPEIYSRIAKIMLPKDYVNFCLTGNFSTDVSDASGTGIFNVSGRNWSDKVCDMFNIPKSWLPKVYESYQKVGNITQNIAQITGLSTDTIVVAGAGDQAAAALGNGIINSGESSMCIGTSGVVFTALDKPLCEAQGRLHTFCHAIPNMWHTMGVTLGCGISLSWFRDNFATTFSYKELDSLAQNLTFGSGGLIYLPYLQGERTPHLDSNIRGAFVGMSATHKTEHFYRAILEGVAMSLRDCKELIEGLGVVIPNLIVSGGGAKSDVWLGILSEILGLPLIKKQVTESGTRGVAMLASVGSGVYKDIETANNGFKNKVVDTICLQKNNNADKLYSLYKELYILLKDNNKKLATFR